MKIGETEGNVVALGMFTTRLHTPGYAPDGPLDSNQSEHHGHAGVRPPGHGRRIASGRTQHGARRCPTFNLDPRTP